MAETVADKGVPANPTASDSLGGARRIREKESDAQADALRSRIKEVIGDEYVASFGRRTGLGESLLRKYLSGAQPNTFNLVAIADAGGVTVDWLATGREPKFRRDAVSPESAPADASGDIAELVAIYRDAPQSGKNALNALAVAIRDRTMRAWLAAGQAIAEAADLFDRSK